MTIAIRKSPDSRPGALDLVTFMTKPEGQAIVSKQGYVDLGLHSAGGDVDPRILAVLSRALGGSGDDNDVEVRAGSTAAANE